MTMLAGEQSLICEPAAKGALRTLKLTVIVVNWNVRELLRECLQSVVKAIRLPADAWELIVVDNASADGSAQMVRCEFVGAKLIENRENLGFGRANNDAFARSCGRYILLLNPDAVLLEGAVESLVETLDNEANVAAVGSALLNPDGSHQRWSGGAFPTLANVTLHFLFAYRILPAWMLPPPLYLERQPAKDVAIDWVSAACMILRSDAVDGKLFDERFFMYCEDLDLCQRLRSNGWKVLFTPRARAIHRDGQSIRQQTAQVQAGKLRSLRMAFRLYNPRTPLLLFDAVVALGFLLRYVIYSISLWSAERRQRVTSCGHYLAEAFSTLVRRDSAGDCVS